MIFNRSKRWFLQKPASSSSTDLSIEGDISPSLADPTFLSVVGVVDGQFTGFIMEERRNFIYTSTERTGPGFSALKASADRPAEKNATSDVISSQPIACPSYQIPKLVTCFHRPGRSEVRSSELTSTVITVPALQTRLRCR